MIIIFIIRMAVTVFYFQLIYRIHFFFFSPISCTYTSYPLGGMAKRYYYFNPHKYTR